jgi:hypothetical protein
MHKLWTQCGKPKSGIINGARLKAKYDYKLAIKNAAMEFEKLHADEISDYLIQKDSSKFWKAWNSHCNISDRLFRLALRAKVTPLILRTNLSPISMAFTLIQQLINMLLTNMLN